MADAFLLHTDEIVLKGGNRDNFERLLVDAVCRRVVGERGSFRLCRRKGSVILRHEGEMPEELVERTVSALKTVFGVAHFFVTTECEKDLGRMKDVAVALMAGKSGTFRVTARRADKKFPHQSTEVARQLGGAVLAANRDVSVDLHSPDIVLQVEINEDGAFLSVRREPGAGGLPTDSTGKLAVMLSGGIDSPVAAWKVMRRGCRAVFVHFHSYPHVGRESIEKVRRLAAVLDRYQLGSVLHLVPFAEIQREITARTSSAMRVVLYRRMMIRIAQEIARREGALGIVTGDSIGQVASQTPENLYTVSAAASMPIYRPLAGDDKRDITEMARRIGTYDISVEPHDDCCSLFVPDHPELHSTPAQAAREEAKLDVAALVGKALGGVESWKLGAGSWELGAGSQ